MDDAWTMGSQRVMLWVRSTAEGAVCERSPNTTHRGQRHTGPTVSALCACGAVTMRLMDDGRPVCTLLGCVTVCVRRCEVAPLASTEVSPGRSWVAPPITVTSH
eukprot:1415812-Prymnesium_polylepis.1